MKTVRTTEPTVNLTLSGKKNLSAFFKAFQMRKYLLIAFAIALCAHTYGQRLGSTPEYVKSLTSRWTGDRFEDGRPKVSDVALASLKECTLEQIWGYLNNKGYHNQVEKDWIILKPGDVMTGRVVTAQFMP